MKKATCVDCNFYEAVVRIPGCEPAEHEEGACRLFEPTPKFGRELWLEIRRLLWAVDEADLEFSFECESCQAVSTLLENAKAGISPAPPLD